MADDEAPADQAEEERRPTAFVAGDGGEGEAPAGPAGPELGPYTMEEVFSLFVPSQNTLDKIVAKAEYTRQLKAADEEACEKAKIIQELKMIVEELEQRYPMTKEDSDLLDEKQRELFEKLLEFEELTRRVHDLAELAELDSKSSFRIPPYDDMVGPPIPTSAILDFNKESTGVQAPETMADAVEFIPPKEKLPKMVVCGTGDWPPKLVMCENPKKKTVERGTNTESQVVLKIKNEVKKTKSGSQIPVKKLYNKLQDLNKDVIDVEEENAQLTRKLLELLQGPREEYGEEQPSVTESLKGESADVLAGEDEDALEGEEYDGEGPEGDNIEDIAGDNPENIEEPAESMEMEGEEAPIEGSITKEPSAEVEKLSQLESLAGAKRKTKKPVCTCGMTSNVFSLEFELNKIGAQVQRMLADIESKEKLVEVKPAVVIGTCNVATLFNPS